MKVTLRAENSCTNLEISYKELWKFNDARACRLIDLGLSFNKLLRFIEDIKIVHWEQKFNDVSNVDQKNVKRVPTRSIEMKFCIEKETLFL